MPSFESIKDGTYAPLSRPLYLYVNTASLERPEVKAFVKFYIENAKELSAAVGYISSPDETYAKDLEKLK